MALSRVASDLAAEINYHDWSDAPFRIDRAGHRREHDGGRAVQDQLDQKQMNNLRTNVMWVVAQVLGHHDPNLDVYEFAEACGVSTRTPSGRPRSGHITAGLRWDGAGRLQGPVRDHRCHVCSRAVDPDEHGEVRLEGITRTGFPNTWVWGPVVVHESCRTGIVTSLDRMLGNGYESTWAKIEATA